MQAEKDKLAAQRKQLEEAFGEHVTSVESFLKEQEDALEKRRLQEQADAYILEQNRLLERTVAAQLELHDKVRQKEQELLDRQKVLQAQQAEQLQKQHAQIAVSHVLFLVILCYSPVVHSDASAKPARHA